MPRWETRDRMRLGITVGLAGFSIVGSAALAYAALIEPRRLQVVRYRLGVADLPDAMEGVRIVHLTDFHVGMAGTRQATLRRAIAVTAASRPDLVALTGDFTHAGVWERGAALFRGLAEATPCLAVLGNHDHLAGESEAARIVAHLDAQGVRVLTNEQVVVPIRNGAGRLLVVGVDDPRLGFDDLSEALEGAEGPVRSPRLPAILLGHVPDIVEQAPPGRFALTLAGHTHGGQLRFSPLKRFSWLELPMIVGDLESGYPRGTHLVNGNPLSVSNGLGVSGVPLRMFAPPQVTVFSLTARLDTAKAADDPARYLIPE